MFFLPQIWSLFYKSLYNELESYVRFGVATVELVAEELLTTKFLQIFLAGVRWAWTTFWYSHSAQYIFFVSARFFFLNAARLAFLSSLVLGARPIQGRPFFTGV